MAEQTNIDDVRARFGATADLVAEHADAHCGIDIAAVVEGRYLVGDAIAIGVFEDEDAVAFRAFAVVAAIILHIAKPDPAAVIDIEVGRVGDFRLGRE